MTIGNGGAVSASDFKPSCGGSQPVSSAATDTQPAPLAPPPTTIPVTQTTPSTTVAGAQYSYKLPNGWQNAPVTDPKSSQSYNKADSYLLSISTYPLPSGAGNIASVKQVLTNDKLKQLIQGEFSDAVIGGISSGSIAGQDALIATFIATLTVTADGAQKQSKPLTMLQYDTVNKNILYTLVFMAPQAKETAATADFQAIINSFTFKQ
jgi:hypothetical protein